MNSPKPTLRDTMETMHKLLRGELAPNEVAPILGVPVERVELYQTMVRQHLTNVLEKVYTSLPALLEPSLWKELVDDYFKEYPSHHYELNANGGHFRDFLLERHNQDPHKVSGFILDLAELEWQEWEVYAAPDDDSDKAVGTSLNSTLVILRLGWPAHAFLKEWRVAMNSGKQSPPLPKKPSAETVLLFRHPGTYNIVSIEAREDLLFVVKMLHEKVDIPTASKLANIPKSTIEGFVRQAVELGLAL